MQYNPSTTDASLAQPQGQDEDQTTPQSQALSRRTALQLLGGLLGTALLAGCGGGSSSGSLTGTATGTSTGTTTGTTAGTTDHAVTPEGEIGPYFADDSATGFNRSNVLTNIDGTNAQAGVPFTLHVYVYDTENSYAALAGAQVDVWHCNALGVYSDENSEGTTGQTWLRGHQLTDATGLVTFGTIVPGWYQGRATHIRLRVRSQYSEASSTSDGTNTTQLFFPQATLDSIYTSVAPYSSKGVDTTTNVADHVYTPETKGATEVALTGDSTSGYAATFAIYLPITS